MKKWLKWALLPLCMLLLCGCLDEKPQEYVENTPRLVGVWQMISRETDEGQVFDYSDKQVLFTYYDNNSGEKTIDGMQEYIFTYTYNGKTMITTASYPNNRVSVMNDLVTVDGDTLTIYSYDERVTVTLKKVGVPPTKTTASTGV